MSSVVINTILILSSLGIVAAVILYYVSKKFKVKEDPRIGDVMDALPNTNCGGCGYPGCSAFSEATVKADNLDELHCPVGGNEVMKEVASILGLEAVERDPYVAVIRCAGSFEYRKKTNVYDGAKNCAIAAELYAGDTGCAYGCLGLGDCVDVCDFEAIYIDPLRGIPEVIEDKCTACNACVTECPKDIIELWPVGKKHQRIYVACKNEEKGGSIRKECAVACSGCAKCSDECRYDAITIENNLADVDFEKCKLCLKCVDVCDVRVMMSDNVPEEKIEKIHTVRLKREEKEKEKKRLEREKAKLEKANGSVEPEVKSDE